MDQVTNILKDFKTKFPDAPALIPGVDDDMQGEGFEILGGPLLGVRKRDSTVFANVTAQRSVFMTLFRFVAS
jgi:hypothetical protein